MADVIGKVLDHNDIPIPNVSIILIGGGVSPQVTLTGIDGSFTFNSQGVGHYKLSAIWGRTVVEKVSEIIVGQVGNSTVDFKIITTPPKRQTIDYIVANKYLLLKYGQYAFLAGVGWLFFNKLVAERIPDLSLGKLNNIEIARGTITYLVAVTTISMAAILMLAAIMTGGKDLDKRFTLGKEILTLLIGILGTIIGFYYGSSDKSATIGGADTIQMDTLAISQKGGDIFIKGKIIGGNRPYVYSISSIPNGVVNRITDKFSENTELRDTLNLLDKAKAGTDIKIFLKGKDKNGSVFSKTNQITLQK